MAKKTYDSLFMLNDVVNRPSERPTPRSNSSSSSRRPATTLFGTMSTYDILKVEDNNLPFTGEWEDFLGRPARNFYMNISSQPGDGKSTFALKFANYLASNFGNVIYFANEEDPIRVKTKLNRLGKRLANFEVEFEARTKAIMSKMIAQGGFNHVFIDSLQNTDMDYKELWELHKKFPDTSFTIISRQTKGGLSRGSQNKEYDGDITITFPQKGTARTIKNRFNDLKEYVVF